MIRSFKDSKVRKIEEVDNLPGLHVVENEHLESLLFDRNLTGIPFRKACLEASKLFMGHLVDELKSGSIAELAILSKGLIYQLPTAATEIDLNLPINLVAASRSNVRGQVAEVNISYSQFDAGGSELLIGDTIASGSTIIAALKAYQNTHSLDGVYIVSYAGTALGARRILEYCKSAGIQCTMLFGLAAFGLADNGFDLPFNHPDTITEEKYKERAAAQFSGKPVSAIGWDFGSQAMAPNKYQELCWLEAELHGLHDNQAFSLARRPKDLERLTHESGALGSPREECDQD